MPIPLKTSRAIKEGRTLFKNKVVDPPPIDPLKLGVLKRADTNNKLGKGDYIVRKGKLRGMPMFHLSLEERKTCPTYCFHYKDCYMNHVPFALRFNYGDKLLNSLDNDLNLLHNKWNKFLVRLHVAGDFPNAEYVKFWKDKLKQYAGLHIFGYTAYTEGPINKEIRSLVSQFRGRAWIRFSHNRSYNSKSPNLLFAVREEYKGESFICPEQVDKTDSCLTCALCFGGTTKSVKFINH